MTSMSMGDETQSDFGNLKELVHQDFGFQSEPLLLEHKEVVVDMISRSFAEKGDLTTLANVTYDNIAEQVNFCFINENCRLKVVFISIKILKSIFPPI